MYKDKNKAVREALKMSGVRHYELADALGISEFTLARKLRKELNEADKVHYLRLIEKIAKKKEEEA